MTGTITKDYGYFKKGDIQISDIGILWCPAQSSISPRAPATRIPVVILVLKNNSSTAIASGEYLFIIVDRSL